MGGGTFCGEGVSNETPDEKASNLAAAEDLRRQIQARDAAKPDAVTIDRAALLSQINARPDRLLQISKSVGLSNTESQAAADEYIRLISETKTRSEHDDPNWERHIETLRTKIEAACATLRLPLKDGVAIGINPVSNFNASQYRVPLTHASIVSLGAHNFHLCSVVSKAIARSLVYTPLGHEQNVSFDPANILAKIKNDESLTRYWASILISFAILNDPRLVPFELQAPNEAPTRFQMLEAMELFVVAHEIGHHVTGSAQLRNDPIPPTTNKDHREEYHADLIAGAILVYLGGKPNPINLFAGSGAAPALLLSVFDMIARTRALLSTGQDNIPPSESHPAIRDRISALDALDLFVHKQERPMLADIRTCFVKIAEDLWTYLRPRLLTTTNDLLS